MHCSVSTSGPRLSVIVFIGNPLFVVSVERGKRIELSALAWKAKVLPLYEPRVLNTYMIIITPVDKQCNLFSVENVYSNELIAEIQTLDLMSYPYEKVHWQEHMPRRRLQFDETNILARLNQENTANLPLISRALGIEIKDLATAVWLDHDQFSMDSHEDNPAVDISMQVYLLPNVVNAGTKFYHSLTNIHGQRYAGSLRHDFPYTVNTGYIMVNAPGLFHGAPNAIPAGTIRCSSYSYLIRQ